MRSRTRSIRAVLGLALPLLSAAALRGDGTQTGIIAGEVVDSTRIGLPGVEVTVSGLQIRRTALTDEQGRFRFPALGLGTYQVTAQLLGLETTQPEVQVFLGKTTEVRLELREGSPAESSPAVKDWIEVVAEAPLIDKFDSKVGASVSAELLDSLPVQRFYQSVAQVLPGISGGQDGNPNVSGALRGSNLFLVDGVDTTDPTTGLFGLNLNYEAIQEVNVATAALPAEYGRA
jgi:carboxypeptidase family protein/TonB-dependent receptor-like protein